MFKSVQLLLHAFVISSLDQDECFLGTHNCHNDAGCINNKGSFQCECNTGYNGTGVLCQGKLHFIYGWLPK